MWLKKQVEESGARLAVVVLPCRENVYLSQSPQADEIQRGYAAVVTVLRDVAAKEDIPFAEVVPALRKTAIQSQQLLYYDGRFETHPTPAGYRAIAKGVAAFLLESGFIPTPGGPRAPLARVEDATKGEQTLKVWNRRV